MSLTIATTTYGSTVVLKCDGRVVLGSAQVLRDKATAALQEGARNIIVDLSGVNYTDSSGIGELVSAYTVTRNSGGELVLAGLSNKVRDLFHITRLIQVFPVFATADAALEHFNLGSAHGGNDEAKV